MRQHIIKYSPCMHSCFIFLLLIAAFVADESYWRDVGHVPNAFNFLEWLAIFFNLPSFFLSMFLAQRISPSYSLQSNLELIYLIWSVLAFFQWRLYLNIANKVNKNYKLLKVLLGIFFSLEFAALIALVVVWPKIPNEIWPHYELLYIPVGIAALGGMPLNIWWLSHLMYNFDRARMDPHVTKV